MCQKIKDDIGNGRIEIKRICVGEKYMTFCCPTNASDLS